MKHQRFHNLATIISTGLCIFFLASWHASFMDYFNQSWALSNNDFYELRLQHGIIELDHTVCTSRNFPADMPVHYRIWAMPQGFNWEWNQRCKSVLGMGIRNEPLIYTAGNVLVVAGTRSVSVSLWVLTIFAAVLPMRRLLHWYRLNQLGPDACRGCGYDLTGNASGVCPECGMPTSNKLEAVG